MSLPSVAQKISQLEELVGRLSPVQKMLLGTDGSVTNLLEVITGSPVEIETVVQEVIPADSSIATELVIDEGDEVNYRVVKLKKSGTSEPLIYAVSHTPLKRLEPSFREDLIRADIPIGVILKNHQIESRRDITGAEVRAADKDHEPGLQHLSRGAHALQELQDRKAWQAIDIHKRDLSLQPVPG